MCACSSDAENKHQAGKKKEPMRVQESTQKHRSSVWGTHVASYQTEEAMANSSVVRSLVKHEKLCVTPDLDVRGLC
ncbi:hypothetical protein M404DRAFT_776849 [Pisolithus tinctorius Marx 270]|uniref:Uncharacterized protein n=1 Tax=Pisolithus tinctorius Marx 270 TaxID=870435 RepID=A0A0C3NXV9_PISTI|nr:hypothetical protein M404DRAFT_776849 [Pisolithus tinctorius Marx 270]